MARLLNGNYITLSFLTNTGQFDGRYMIKNQPTDLNLLNLNQDFNFYKNTNFNITNSVNLFTSDDGASYTGFLPNVTSGRMIIVKNLGSDEPFTISGYNSDQKFDRSADEVLNVYSTQGVTLLGVLTDDYTGWANVSMSQGIS